MIAGHQYSYGEHGHMIVDMDDVIKEISGFDSCKAQAVPEGFVLVPFDVADRCIGHISLAMCHQNNSNAENDVMQLDLDILGSVIEAQEQN